MDKNLLMQFFAWFKTSFEGMHQAIRTLIITLFSMAAISVAVIMFVGDRIQDYIEVYQKTPREQAEIEDLKSQYRDTIIQQRREAFTMKSMSDQKEIGWILDGLEYNLKNWNNITIWKIHDHGGPLNNGEQKYMSILFTRENIFQVDIKEAYIDRIMPTGYSEYFQKILDKKSFYMPDVRIYPEIYSNKTKDNMDFWRTKSAYGSLIKTLPSGVVFISVGFRTLDPKEDDPLMGAKIENAKEVLKNLIYDVPESLRN